MARFELRPFALPEAETVAAWAASQEDRHFLNAPDDTALTADDVAAWTYEADYALTLRRDGDLAAYAEIVEDVVEQDIEIQHLLVAPDLRSHGIGEAMLRRLCTFLAEARPYPEVWLRVHRDNTPAVVCAAAAGFAVVEKMSGPRYQWYRKSLSLQ